MAKRAQSNRLSDTRRGLPKPVGELLAGAGAGAFRRFGFAEGQLVARWREIVGPLYARWSAPEALRPSRGKAGQSGATLVVRVEGPFALQLQHAEPMILERCNRIVGTVAVGRVRLIQGPVPSLQPAVPDEPLRTAASEPGVSLKCISDPGLRTALEDLARFVSTTKGPPRVA